MVWRVTIEALRWLAILPGMYIVSGAPSWIFTLFWKIYGWQAVKFLDSFLISGVLVSACIGFVAVHVAAVIAPRAKQQVAGIAGGAVLMAFCGKASLLIDPKHWDVGAQGAILIAGSVMAAARWGLKPPPSLLALAFRTLGILATLFYVLLAYGFFVCVAGLFKMSTFAGCVGVIFFPVTVVVMPIWARLHGYGWHLAAIMYMPLVFLLAIRLIQNVILGAIVYRLRKLEKQNDDTSGELCREERNAHEPQLVD